VYELGVLLHTLEDVIDDLHEFLRVGTLEVGIDDVQVEVHLLDLIVLIQGIEVLGRLLTVCTIVSNQLHYHLQNLHQNHIKVISGNLLGEVFVDLDFFKLNVVVLLIFGLGALKGLDEHWHRGRLVVHNVKTSAQEVQDALLLQLALTLVEEVFVVLDGYDALFDIPKDK